MKSFSSIFKRILLVVALTALCAAGALAQKGGTGRSRDEHFISARAGGVNHVAGQARFRAKDSAEWLQLSTDVTLAAGDSVSTGPFSQVEVLLNPGSYFRLGENSEFTLSDDSLESLRLTVTRGSGVVEAIGFDQLKVSIIIDTPHTRVEIVRSGLYRVNVLPGNVTEVAVVKGRAMVGREQALKVKGGRAARAGAAGTELFELDKKRKDSLDVWSKERGQTLAKLNQKLSRRTVNALLASTDWDRIWPSSGPVGGFWFYSLGPRCWVFLPGGFGYWSSPYGSSYGNMLWFQYPGRGSCQSCLSGGYPHVGIGGNGGGMVGGGVGTGPGGGNGGNGGGHVGPPPTVTPPAPPREFVRPSMDAPRERIGPAMPTRDQ